MSDKAEQDFCDNFAPELLTTLEDLLTKMRVDAHISFPVVEEVVIHFWRDLERLYAIHHAKVNITKGCSYLAFWVRKLKPISDAYPSAYILSDDTAPDLIAEVTDINEQMAVHLAFRLMRNCLRDHRVLSFSHLPDDFVLTTFDRIVEEYLGSDGEAGLEMGRRFDNIVYDMRFRTYGPHHLTHLLVNIVRDLYRECATQLT